MLPPGIISPLRKQQHFFEFQGITYSGYIVSSTDIQPHFHWFMFNDPSVIEQYGDSIAFKVEANQLIALYHLTAADFVAAVQHCVQQYLDNHMQKV